jgi:hypothetical protein
MRIATGLVALLSVLAIPVTVITPAASAEGHCRDGWNLYDTGVPGGFKEDRNLNGLVCERYKQTSTGDYRHWYADDR